jgi:outer membrane protein OmpA-like peptidoglycan-associated protein
MKKYPKLSLEIRGHTDDIGGDEYNLKLSTERANEVMDLLINQGISPTKLIAKGFGKTKPLNPNDNDENRKKNRRTEFVILSK